MDQPTSAQPSTPEQPVAPVQAAPAPAEAATQPTAAEVTTTAQTTPVTSTQPAAMPSQVPTMPTLPGSADSQKKPFLSRYKFTILSIIVVLLALVPLVFLSKHVQAPVKPVAQKVSPTPTTVPMTEQNAVPTIDATQKSIDNTMTQANQDLQAAGNINTSQDSVSGL